MTQHSENHISQSLASLMPRRRIRALSRALGVVKRRRKLDIVAFVYSLVLGFSTGDERRLSALRRAYLRATGVRLAPSSFHARFTAGLAELMRTLLTEALQRQAKLRTKMRHLFAPFIEVLAVDSSLVRLHDALADFYPSVWTNHTKASAKLTVVMNVVGRGAKSVKITHGSHHDVHQLHAGRWMRGRLLLFDLGYFRAALFREIGRYHGFFMTRAHKSANPEIKGSYRRKHRHLVGFKLKEALELVDDDLVDFEAEMVYQSRSEKRPFVTNLRQSFRFVGHYNHDHDCWHFYVTNLPTSMMKARHFGAIYAGRWEVELLFRELKSNYRVDHMPSANRHVTETLLYAALLALVVSHALYRRLMSRWRRKTRRHPRDRWALLFSISAPDLLDIMVTRCGRRWREQRLEIFLRTEAMDPNRARLPLPHRAQKGQTGWD